VSDLSGRLAALSPEKRALLEKALLARHASAGRPSTIPRRDTTGPCPLSFSQQRLWFLDQLAPGQPIYNAALAMRIRGPLDVTRLNDALRQVIERHEVLRTVLVALDGRPTQVVLDHWQFDVQVSDVSMLPEHLRDAEVARLVREECRRPFDLARDLMLRAVLHRRGPEDHVLTLIEHHIAFDGWSDAVMYGEIEESYRAAALGRAPRFPELTLQYGDFAVWQRRRQDELVERHGPYWRQMLEGAAPLLGLPTDRPRPPVQTFVGAHYPVTLPSALATGTRELSRAEGATPFMVLLAGFYALVHRWSGAEDVLVGSPIANRGRVELEQLIGFFSNTLVLRAKVDPARSFRQLVRSVKEVALGAFEHQELPFEKVVEVIRPPRDPAFNPIFQINFRAQATRPEPLNLEGLTVTPMEVDLGFSRFDLALELQLHDLGIGGYLEYNEALFDSDTAVWLVDALEQLLDDALSHPDTAVGALRFPTRPPRSKAGIRGARGRQ
jgi:hypothetical protein